MLAVLLVLGLYFLFCVCVNVFVCVCVYVCDVSCLLNRILGLPGIPIIGIFAVQFN